jgi:hypothetical protein
VKRDRVVLKGFGLHFEGEGRPALTLTYCATGLLLLLMVVICVTPATIGRELLSLAKSL